MSEYEGLISTSYTLPPVYKERLEQLAKAQDLKASQLLRRILAEYFARLDADLVNTPAGNGKEASA